jgi:hypothetical protein
MSASSTHIHQLKVILKHFDSLLEILKALYIHSIPVHTYKHFNLYNNYMLCDFKLFKDVAIILCFQKEKIIGQTYP